MRNARQAPINYRATSALVLSLTLAACGGGGSSASIGGTVTGLANGRTLVLQNNGADTFTITGNGSNSFTFNFATALNGGDAYNATVFTQPLGQTCIVANGAGNVNSAGSPVAGIAITCAVTSSVVGTVSGLGNGVAVTLVSNGVSLFAGNGTFQFPGVLPAGTAYTVTVGTQPLNQTCTVANGTGTVVANVSSQVTVACQ